MTLRPRIAMLGAAAVWAALLSATGPVAVQGAGPSGGTCQLQGLATLSPGLSSTSQNFTYNFTGNLTNCQSTTSGAPAGGTTSAGIALPESVTLTNTSTGAQTTGTVSYQEPIPAGVGSCANSTTSGQALTTWSDGTHTVSGYTTNGALAAVALQGTVQADMVLNLVASSVPAGFTAPATFTIATTRFTEGQTEVAPLAFTPASQSEDCATVPVTTANINGDVTIGSTS